MTGLQGPKCRHGMLITNPPTCGLCSRNSIKTPTQDTDNIPDELEEDLRSLQEEQGIHAEDPDEEDWEPKPVPRLRERQKPPVLLIPKIPRPPNPPIPICMNPAPVAQKNPDPLSPPKPPARLPAITNLTLADRTLPNPSLLTPKEILLREEWAQQPPNLILEVPLKLIRTFPGQPRESILMADVLQIAADMRTNGQRMPILGVLLREDPHYAVQIVDGEHRFLAARHIGLATLRVTRVQITDEHDMFLKSVGANLFRVGHTPMEYARILDTLRKNGKTVAQLMEMFQKSEAWVYQYLSLMKLHPQIQTLLGKAVPEEERLGFQVALVLSHLEPERQIIILNELRKRGLTGIHATTYIRNVDQQDPQGGWHKSQFPRRGPRKDLEIIRRALETLRDRVAVISGIPEQDVRKMLQGRGPKTGQEIIGEITDTIARLQTIRETFARSQEQISAA
ncbi:MAG: ParB N-terminal domain-containing protein [Candidatus Wildermuthbacteria bacterium]|nr:ParB N-terminal domain-containing protein [Candidatus Wildermuthbacteria bacterium]